MSSEITPFTGSFSGPAKHEDIEEFLDVLDTRISEIEKTYARDERPIIRMKFLRTKLTGVARTFFDSQPSKVQEDWKLATMALSHRFWRPDLETRHKIAMNTYCTMKQGNLPMAEYIAKARSIFDDVEESPRWNNLVAVRMVTGLRDKKLKEDIKTGFGHLNFTLEEAVDAIMAHTKEQEGHQTAIN